jgi:hypothetical protein
MIPGSKKAGQGRSWIQYNSTSPSTPLGHQFRSNQKKIKSQINTNYVTPRFQLAAHCEHSEYHTNANQTTTISIIHSCHSPPSYYMVVKLIITHHTANQTQILYKQLEWITTLQQQTVLVGLFWPILMGQKCVSYQGPKRGFAYQCAIYFLCTPASLWRFNDLPPSFSSLDLDHENNFSSMVKYSHCSHLGHWPRLSVLVSNYGHLELLTFLETCWILRYSMMTSEMLVTTFMEGKQLSCACIRNVLPFIHP